MSPILNSKIAKHPQENKKSKLIFIVGVPRSGTTWLWGLLTSHPDVAPIVREDFDPDNPSVIDGKRVTSETGAFIRYDDDKIVNDINRKIESFRDKVLVEKLRIIFFTLKKSCVFFLKQKLFMWRAIPER